MYVYLQEKINGSWVDAATNDEYFFYINDTNSDMLIFTHTYSTLVEGGIYRIKCVTRDFLDGAEFSYTSYSNQF